MQTYKYQKGMTLIEIVVVLMISSLLMLVVSGLILNSMGFFNKTVNDDMDKRAADAISEFVRDELIYATDVKIQVEKPAGDDWHSISLEKKAQDSILYLNHDDKQTFLKDFYNQRKLNLKARLYENDYRVDLSFVLLDQKDQQVYKTAATLELINMKGKSIINDGTKDVVSKNYGQEVSILPGGNKIYYQRSNLNIKDDGDNPENPDIEWTGTVSDEIYCANESNTFDWDTGRSYKKGSFVEFEGVWYRAIRDVKNSSDPEKNVHGDWKVIAKAWHENSSYEKNDVIIYPDNTENYYICILSYDHYNNTSNKPTENNSNYWKKIPKEEVDTDKYKSCKVEDGCMASGLKTVKDEICEMNSKITEPNLYSTILDGSTNNKGDWNDILAKYQYATPPRYFVKGDFVYYNGMYYRYTNTIPQPISQQPGLPGINFFKIIQEDWLIWNCYMTGDVIKYQNAYYRSLTDINYDTPTSARWEKVIPNETGDAWIKAS